MSPAGPAATSSPWRGAAELWLKNALHLCAVLYSSMGEGGREAALDTSCSSWVRATVCCPGRGTSLEHLPATAPHCGLCTKAFGIAQSIPGSAHGHSPCTGTQRMPAVWVRVALPSHTGHLSSTLQRLDHNFLTYSLSNFKSNPQFLNLWF